MSAAPRRAVIGSMKGELWPLGSENLDNPYDDLFWVDELCCNFSVSKDLLKNSSGRLICEKRDGLR